MKRSTLHTFGVSHATHLEVSFPNMLRRAWRLGASARGGAASTSAVSPRSAAHAATPRARLAPWSAAPLSSRADGPDEEQARRRALRRAARRELRAWRGADVTPRELRELKDGGGSKRRWARDWASAVFADDVGDGASYEAFVAEALRHGDGRRGPGSNKQPASDTGADTRRARREKTKTKTTRSGSGAGGLGSGAPKGGGTRGVKYKHRRGDAKSSRRPETSRRRRGANDDDDPVDWHEEHAFGEADAFWRAFLRAARSGVGARKKNINSANEGFERSFRFEDFARGGGARSSETFRGGDDDDRSRDAFVTCPDRSALGIAPGVALDKTLLKSSLRAAAMKWHPDRHAGAAAKRDAEAAFKKCYDAYDALVERTSV